MKKKILLTFLSAVFTMQCFSQADSTFLFNFNKSRNKITGIGIKTLGVWSVGNVAASSYGYYATKGSDEYFNQMNVMWNGVNLAIVAASLIPRQQNNLNFSKSLKSQHSAETIYITNAMLDLVYTSIGLYLTEKAKNDLPNKDKWNGWGNSLIMQGGFLFILDTSVFIVHKKNGKKLYKLLDSNKNQN